MAAKIINFSTVSTEELLKVLEVVKCLFDYQEKKEMADKVDREILSLLTGKKHQHVLERTPVEIEQNNDLFDFNSIRPVKHL